MNDDMIKYAQQLRRLVEGYYYQQMTAEEYRAQRKVIFDHIENEFAGGYSSSETGKIIAEDKSTSPS